MNIRALSLAAAISGFAFTAQAAVVGVFGTYPGSGYVNNGLSGFGHTVVNVTTANAASLATLDVLVMGRSQSGNSDIAAFVSGGGMLITEWASTAYGMSLLGGTTAFGGVMTNDIISVTAAGLDLGLASYSDNGATEFFQNFSSLGSGTVYARRGSNNSAAVVGGAFGSGWVWANGYDWADGGGAATFAFLDSQIDARVRGTVPEPASIALVGLALVGAACARRRKA